MVYNISNNQTLITTFKEVQKTLTELHHQAIIPSQKTSHSFGRVVYNV